VLRKTPVLALVLTVALFSGWILDRLPCYVNNSCSDVWMLEPAAALAIVVVPCYSIITLGMIFASAVVIRKRFSTWLSALIPAGTLSLLLSALFYSPEVDSFTGILGLFGWLAVPWFLCSYVGLRLWPKNDRENSNGDIYD
jgi:hypothetical protein